MSYKSSNNIGNPQLTRQQEKLRIAREALARIEAKYAPKRSTKHKLVRPMGARRPRAER